MAARECYIAMMEIDDHLQAMNIEEHRTATEPVEKIKEVLLRQSRHPPRTHGFSEKQSRHICWTHEDMPGIDPSVIVHR